LHDKTLHDKDLHDKDLHDKDLHDKDLHDKAPDTFSSSRASAFKTAHLTHSWTPDSVHHAVLRITEDRPIACGIRTLLPARCTFRLSPHSGPMFSDLFNSIRFLMDTKAGDAKIMARVAEEQRRRLAAMALDPVRKKYVTRIEAGEHWHDEDITFNEDPNATSVCEHLRPIEQLMRANGIDLRLAGGLRINANCLVDFDKVKIHVSVPESVAYGEPHIPDRSMLDPRSAMIKCDRCTSIIFAVHRDTATPETPSFPR